MSVSKREGQLFVISERVSTASQTSGSSRVERLALIVMTNGGAHWEGVQTLAVGDHLHLDKLVEQPPPAGSQAWLPTIRQLVDYLGELGGHWVVTLPVGEVGVVPGEVTLTADRVFDYTDTSKEYEPPAVYRLGDEAILNTWEGERHLWSAVVGPNVIESISLNRPKDEAPEGGGWFAQITFEIRR